MNRNDKQAIAASQEDENENENDRENTSCKQVLVIYYLTIRYVT